MFTIREERSDDIAEVYQVNLLAFGNEAEPKLVDTLRRAKNYLGLVAERDGKVVGHISFSALTLNEEESKFVGLAPMSVLPELQSQGIGSALVKEGLQRCLANDFTAVFVLGHPEYYPRLGFHTASAHGFSSEYLAPDEAFMVLELQPGALDGLHGLIKYGPEFAML